ncbi:MAG: insulinase family protein [Candidatus Pacebacteria bacterium]|nr:insulinase family protein [Candidatus Paceibacterota bacterium]MCF7862637.1 insulinase family protein [Candidatus Paceibacterota bacterium]
MKYKINTLKNGLRVLTVPMKDNPTANVLILVETGSKYEDKKVNGISHFLEHMFFKGTTKRPKAIDISRELDSIGSQYNAFTSYEYTGYYAKSSAKNFKKIFDIVSDIYLNSTLPVAEIEKEKGVIIEEMNMYKDMPNIFVQDIFMKLLYGDQPAGWSILGEKENILAMKQDDFVEYKKLHYVPEATLFVVAGNVTTKDVLIEAQKVFGQMPKSKKGTKKKTIDTQQKPAVLMHYKDTDQAHFILGFRSYDLFNKRDYAITILSTILGGGMSSRLFEKLREEMGVGYYVNAYNDTSTDHGSFQISAGVDKGRLKEVIQVVLEECKKILENGVPEEEVKKAQEYLIGNMKLSLESSSSLASFYGQQELFREKIRTPEEKAKALRMITNKDVQKVAKEIFQNTKLNLAIVGPFKDEGEFLKILKV